MSNSKKSRQLNVQVATDSFTKMSHQAHLLEQALQQNTVVCLGSEMGKFFIAVSMIRELAHQVRKPITEGGKLIVLLFYEESQASQHTSCIQLHTDLKVCMFPKDCNPQEQNSKVTGHHVLVMTPCVLHAFLTNGVMSLIQVNLIIVDECHRAINDDIFHRIMQCYDSCQSHQCPRILGITTTVLNDKCDSPSELERELNSLESVMRSSVQASKDVLSSDVFSHQVEETILHCEQYNDQSGLVKDIDDILESCFAFMKGCKLSSEEVNGDYDPWSIPRFVYSECQLVLHLLGPWCASRVAQAFVRQLNKLIEVETAILRRQLLQWAHTQLQMISTLFEFSFNQVMCLDDFKKLISSKVKQLLEVLYTFKPADNYTIVPYNGVDDYLDIEEASDESDLEPDDDDEGQQRAAVVKTSQDYVTLSSTSGVLVQEKLCGVVVCDRRHVAFALNKLIEELGKWDEDLFFVESSHIFGAGSVDGHGKRLKVTDVQCRRQEQVLRRFRMKEINLLVATGALEEGVDLPPCNLVVKFDVPTTFRSYVQSKGCAKASKAKYVVLVDQETMSDFSENLVIFKGVEKILKSRCNNSVDSYDPDCSSVDDLLPPYVAANEEEGSSVTMSSAIEIVNRYCARLPSDAFTHLAPRCTTKQIDGQYVSTLWLPINSPIKVPITGASMKSEKLAERAVALKTCEVLHKTGELDNKLNPVQEEMLSREHGYFGLDDEDVREGQPRPGTTKRKQYYYKKLSTAFRDSYPRPGKPCFLYVIDMKLTAAITEEQNTRGRSIDDPQSTPLCLGILTAKPLPAVPEFPVFTRSGEVTVSVNLVRSEVAITEAQMLNVCQFHRYLFSQVLRLEKSPMIFDPQEAPVGFAIVPMLKGDCGSSELDWSFVQKICDSQGKKLEKKGATCTPSNPFIFVEEEFKDTVIMPSYRNIDQPQSFYMADILWELTPLSPFPSPEFYKSFNDYYVSKYGLVITNLKQPLLDVDHTTARMNLSTPRYINQKGVALPTSSAQTKKSLRENLQQKQIFIPELCIIHPVPASLWRKMVCLPTVLYRMNYLFVADELRERIAREAHIGVIDLPSDFRFPKLEFAFGVRRTEKSKATTGVTSDEEGVESDTRNSLQSKDLSESEPAEEGHDLDFGVWKTPKEPVGDAIEEDIKSQKDEDCEKDGWPVLSDANKNSEQDEAELFEELSADCSVPGTDSIADNNSTGVVACTSNMSTKVCESVPVAIEVNDLDAVKVPGDLAKSVTDSTDNADGVYFEAETDNVVNEKLCVNEKIEHSNSCVSEKIPRLPHPSDSSLDGNAQTMITSKNKNQCCSNHSKSEGKTKFDSGVDLTTFLGPSPCLILQTLTMSNANDFFNLERLETIGDSFLKFAITVYLYCSYPSIHEGKLSFLRSKQVSNFNLYRLGKLKNFGQLMIASKFEPVENWLPPGYVVDKDKGGRIRGNADNESWGETQDEKQVVDGNSSTNSGTCDIGQMKRFNKELEEISEATEMDSMGNACFVPYDLLTQHSLPDKSIADCVESLIGCYLTVCGSRAALQFMSWLGLKVIPKPVPTALNSTDKSFVSGESHEKLSSVSSSSAEHISIDNGKTWTSSSKQEPQNTDFPPPTSPLLTHVPDAEQILNHHLIGFDEFENIIEYKFNDRSYLLQAFSHASFHYNTVTDCYQRLEFLGDAILDYIVTHHLYEDKQMFSPGILTDLRSALVNNNIFAVLAVKWNFHKYFKSISPQLFSVIQKFVSWMETKGDNINLEEELIEEDDEEEEAESEHIEIPKALGDIFESVAGAIYLDSGYSLDTVWRVYYRMMKSYIDEYTDKIPKSPVRELLEMEPETAKFERPSRTLEGKIRVTVNVVGKGSFCGIGRNYRIAKSAAAKRALRMIKSQSY